LPLQGKHKMMISYDFDAWEDSVKKINARSKSNPIPFQIVQFFRVLPEEQLSQSPRVEEAHSGLVMVGISIRCLTINYLPTAQYTSIVDGRIQRRRKPHHGIHSLVAKRGVNGAVGSRQIAYTHTVALTFTPYWFVNYKKSLASIPGFGLCCRDHSGLVF